jgi:hypothetical protein
MRNKRISTPFALCCGLLLASFAANAQTTVNQLLDSTFFHGQDKAAELVFDNPSSDYEYLGIEGTALQACKLTAFNGLFCLDGKIVRNWPHPATQVVIDNEEVVVSSDVLTCENNTLGLDDNKANTCTGMTVDFDGNIWLAGKNKGKSHSLIKVAKKDPDCPQAEPGETFLGELEGNTELCAYEVATGRPLLVDLAPVDGVAAKQFSLPGHEAPLPAILGLEERKTAVAFLEGGVVYEIASGKSDWGLVGNEQLLGIALLQLKDPLENYVLVATSKGRVLAWDASGDKAAFVVFNMRDSSNYGLPASFDRGPCSSGDPVYSVRASSTTGLVYVTDSEYCEVSTLTASRNTEGTLSLALDSTFSTREEAPSTTVLTAVTGVTVAPGNNIDMSTCSNPLEPCALVLDDEGNAAASMAGVKLVDAAVSGLTLFQVEGMPDCRYVPLDCLAFIPPIDPAPTTPAAAVSALVDAGVIVPLTPGATNPGAQRLNITPLLPDEVTELFPAGLPDMLLPRYFRGQRVNGFVFGGFFGVTEDGVVFRDTFEGRYDVGSLAGSSLGCADNLGSLDWDIIGTVSERWISASDPYSVDPLHLAAIVNSDCGTSRSREKGWSFKPYNLEPTPCTFNPDLMGVWSDDGICALQGGTEEPDDAVYAKMLLVMADDYGRTLNDLACEDADGNGVAPLDSAACLQLQGNVTNMLDKLNKCWDATQQPKQSSGDQNCQAFDSQLGNLQQLLEQTPVVGPDYANRLGELKARAATMRHVFETRFIPSLALTPNGQFEE